MGQLEAGAIRRLAERIIAEPTAADLWQLQQELLLAGGEDAARARTVARAFHGCLRNLESKTASRRASRWGAVLGTAAVASVSVDELGDARDDALERLVRGGVPALLEIGSAVKTAQAWEVEAGLVYDDLAWTLYDELWDLSASVRPELTADERRRQIDLVVSPLLDASVPDGDRAAVAVNVFRAVLAARLAPLLGDA